MTFVMNECSRSERIITNSVDSWKTQNPDQMAEMNYRYSENEFLDFVKEILSKGCYIVSGVFRTTPDLICIRNFDEMLQYWEWLKLNPSPGSPGLYILHQEYQECPLFQDLGFNKYAGQQIYSIRQRYGGPSIDLSYCGPEYIQQVIDGSVKVDEEFRQVLLMNFSIFATAKDSSQ